MHLNRSALFKLIKEQQSPKPPQKVIQPSVPVDDEDLSPREIFLQIIKDLNKKPKKGEGDTAEKRKKKAIRELKEFFVEQFPIIDENDEINIF